jgi:predicted ATPase
VTLVGPGGTGKTRLSVEVARALQDEHPDGVWFVELAPVATGGLVPRQVADALGLVLESGRAVLPPLVEHCRRRALLLVFDNAEHLLDAAADLVVTLQRECPRLRVLVTSREPLACDGEHLWEVPTLEVPESWTPAGGQDIIRYSAAELFRQRAASADPRFAR